MFAIRRWKEKNGLYVRPVPPPPPAAPVPRAEHDMFVARAEARVAELEEQLAAATVSPERVADLEAAVVASEQLLTESAQRVAELEEQLAAARKRK